MALLKKRRDKIKSAASKVKSTVSSAVSSVTKKLRSSSSTSASSSSSGSSSSSSSTTTKKLRSSSSTSASSSSSGSSSSSSSTTTTTKSKKLRDTISNVASKVSDAVSNAYSKVDTSLGGVLPGGVSRSEAIISNADKRSEIRAAKDYRQTLRQQDKITDKTTDLEYQQQTTDLQIASYEDKLRRDLSTHQGYEFLGGGSTEKAISEIQTDNVAAGITTGLLVDQQEIQAAAAAAGVADPYATLSDVEASQSSSFIDSLKEGAGQALPWIAGAVGVALLLRSNKR